MIAVGHYDLLDSAFHVRGQIGEYGHGGLSFRAIIGRRYLRKEKHPAAA